MENLLVNLIDCRTADNSAAEYTCHMHTKQAQTHGRVGLLVAINNISMQNKSRWLCFGAYNRWMWNIFVTLLMEALKKMFGDFRRCPVFIFLTHFFSISSWLQEREKKKQPINFMINRHLRHHQKCPVNELYRERMKEMPWLYTFQYQKKSFKHHDG